MGLEIPGTKLEHGLLTGQSSARPRKYGQTIIASKISHQTKPAKPTVNSQPMNQMGPMRVGDRRYQRPFSFSSAMFFSFYQLVYSGFDEFPCNILIIIPLDSKTYYSQPYPIIPYHR